MLHLCGLKMFANIHDVPFEIQLIFSKLTFKWLI